MKLAKYVLALAVLLILTGMALPLATVDIPRWVMGGGGASRNAGPLAMNATAGQPAAGYSSSGPLGLYEGYWGPVDNKGYLPLLIR